jgi:hypothetical protein
LSSVPRVIRGALRLPAFALAGMLANYLALRSFSITQETLGPLTFPWTLLFGTGASAVCWLGFEVGRVRWRRLPATKRADAVNELLAPLGLTLLGYVLAGAIFGLIDASIQWKTPAQGVGVIMAVLLAVALAGARDEPSVFLAFVVGPLLGVSCGFLFGVPLAVVFLLINHPPQCTGRCFQLPNPIAAVLGVFIITAAGLMTGYITGVASGLGLLLCRLTDRQLFREWRQLPSAPRERAEGTAW